MSTIDELATRTGSTRLSAGADCEGGNCQTAICSPCMVVWGLVAVYFLGRALSEVLR